MEAIKIFWATPPNNNIGNALGYQTHIKHIKRYLELGQHAIDWKDPETADVALHIISADHFKPVPGKFNILFTMWEALDVPKTYVEGFNKADLIIVPCTFCKELFKPLTKTPVEICYHGTDVEAYQYHDRLNQRAPYIYKKWPWSKPRTAHRFRYLWVGAPNPRKGYQEVLGTLVLANKFPGIEIWLKTTAPKVNWGVTVKALMKNWRDIFIFDQAHKNYWRRLWINLLKVPRPGLGGKIRRYGVNKNIVFDTRMLKREELIDLYKSANCFIFPTWGEGWGLTLSEALATGCPAIATPVTGCKEFFDENYGYPIRYEVKEHPLQDYNMNARTYRPDTFHLGETMVRVIQEYPEALRRGKKASERIRSKFTWEKSAERLALLIRRYQCLSPSPK